MSSAVYFLHEVGSGHGNEPGRRLSDFLESRAPPHAPLRDVPGRAALAPLASSLSARKQPRPFAAAQDKGAGHFIPTSELPSSDTLARLGIGLRQPGRGRHGAKVSILMSSTGTQWQAASVRSERVHQRPGRQFVQHLGASHCETANALAFLAFFATLSEGSVLTLYFAWTFIFSHASNVKIVSL